MFTEVQPGSFAFGDADYAQNVQEDGSCGEWEQSLWVLTEVMSRSTTRRLAVVDAGLKARALWVSGPGARGGPGPGSGATRPGLEARFGCRVAQGQGEPGHRQAFSAREV